MTCPKCGKELQVGEWPFCGDAKNNHGFGSQDVEDDTILGGFWQENFSDKPEYFESKKEMARRAKELGLEPMVRWSGPNDRHVSRWVSVDLEAGKAIAARQ